MPTLPSRSSCVLTGKRPTRLRFRPRWCRADAARSAQVQVVEPSSVSGCGAAPAVYGRVAVVENEPPLGAAFAQVVLRCRRSGPRSRVDTPGSREGCRLGRAHLRTGPAAAPPSTNAQQKRSVWIAALPPRGLWRRRPRSIYGGRPARVGSGEAEQEKSSTAIRVCTGFRAP